MDHEKGFWGSHFYECFLLYCRAGRIPFQQWTAGSQRVLLAHNYYSSTIHSVEAETVAFSFYNRSNGVSQNRKYTVGYEEGCRLTSPMHLDSLQGIRPPANRQWVSIDKWRNNCTFYSRNQMLGDPCAKQAVFCTLVECEVRLFPLMLNLIYASDHWCHRILF